MVEFFVGKWSEGNEKPFKITELQRQRMQISEREGKADRKVPCQPNVFVGKDSAVSRYEYVCIVKYSGHVLPEKETQTH